MKHLNTDYYVGWLSAAEFYGASHHAPQVFQVATSRTLRQKIIGRSRLQFFHREHLSNVPLIHIESKSAMIPVSSRETTLLDIANDIAFVGGIDNAANIIIELCDDVFSDIDALINISKFYPAAAVRRLGFLLENFTDTSNLDKLAEICIERNTATSVLDPLEKFVGKTDKRWNIKINREVTPDV
jgi:predicted transcriptional regulator of viral defense system